MAHGGPMDTATAERETGAALYQPATESGRRTLRARSSAGSRKTNDSPRVASLTPTRGESSRPGRVGIGRIDHLRQAALPALSAKPGQPADFACPGNRGNADRGENKRSKQSCPTSVVSMSIGQTVQPNRRSHKDFGPASTWDALGRGFRAVTRPVASCFDPNLPPQREASIEGAAALRLQAAATQRSALSRLRLKRFRFFQRAATETATGPRRCRRSASSKTSR